jgi:hypothetical protein
LFIIEVVDDDKYSVQMDDMGESTISLYALTRLQPRLGKTMQQLATVNDTQLCALLDSVSDTQFHRHGSSNTGRYSPPTQNGDHVTSPGCARALDVSIGNERFILDCYNLELGSYDMVLDVQWIKSLGPILWDFGSRTMMFACQG